MVIERLVSLLLGPGVTWQVLYLLVSGGPKISGSCCWNSTQMSDHAHKSSACNTSGFVKIRLRMLQVYQWQNDDVQESLSVSNDANN